MGSETADQPPVDPGSEPSGASPTDEPGTLSEPVRVRLRDLEHTHAVALARLAQREADAAALQRRIEVMRGDMSQALSQTAEARRELERSAHLLSDAQARIDDLQSTCRRLEREREASAVAGKRRIGELEQLVWALHDALGETRDDIERAAASRAWRYGHWMMRVATRLTLRTPKTEGALAAGLRRIEQAQRATRALPPGPPSPPIRSAARDGDA